MKLSLALACVLSSAAGAQSLVELHKLVAPDAAAAQLFGDSVDVHNDTLVVGAPGALHGGVTTGAAYVFVKSGGG